MRGVQPCSAMDIHEDGHAVDGVRRENAICHGRQAGGLRGVEIDGRQRGDCEKGASDGKHALEPRNGPRVNLLSRDQPGYESDRRGQHPMCVPSPAGALPTVSARVNRGCDSSHHDAY